MTASWSGSHEVPNRIQGRSAMPRAPNGELPSVRLIRQVTLTAANQGCRKVMPRKRKSEHLDNHLTAKGPIQAITPLILLSRKMARLAGCFCLVRRECDWLSVEIQTVRGGWDG